ncbi:MAG: hypothetical protein ACOX4F_07190 [Atopobiaceae bacterium]|jgi:hypothetical protein
MGNPDATALTELLAQERGHLQESCASARKSIEAAHALPDDQVSNQLAATLAHDIDALMHAARYLFVREELLVPALGESATTSDLANLTFSQDNRVREALSMAASLQTSAERTPTGSNLESVAFQLEEAVSGLEDIIAHDMTVSYEPTQHNDPEFLATLTSTCTTLLAEDTSVSLWPTFLDRADIALKLRGHQGA